MNLYTNLAITDSDSINSARIFSVTLGYLNRTNKLLPTIAIFFAKQKVWIRKFRHSIPGRFSPKSHHNQLCPENSAQSPCPHPPTRQL